MFVSLSCEDRVFGFCTEVTHRFFAEKKKYGSVLSVLSVLSAVIISETVTTSPFIFNFAIFYCLLYTLTLFTTNPVIEI